MKIRQSVLLYSLLAIIAIVSPILLWHLDLPIVRNTYGKEYEPFELFAFCASLALILITYVEIKKQKETESLEKLVPVLLFTLVSFYFLTIINEFSTKSWDYLRHEKAASSISQGINPYTMDNTDYPYPPLTAQTMALFDNIIKKISWFKFPEWGSIFYFFQCMQYILILGGYLLCHWFLKNLGMKSLQASVLLTVLFLFNNPLVRTIKT